MGNTYYTIGGPLYGAYFTASSGTINITLDGSSDKFGFVFQPVDDMTITKLGFAVNTITGTATTWRISLQGVDATNGNPDGTVKGGGSPASTTFTNSSLSAGTFAWLTLDNSYSASRGEFLSLVVEYSSGTTPSPGVDQLVGKVRGAGNAGNNLFPYNTNDTTGAWVHSNQHPPYYGYATSTQAHGYPIASEAGVTFNSGSSPAIRGMSFNLPGDLGSTYTVRGIGGQASYTSGSSVAYKLYDTDGTTVLHTITHDTDVISGTGTRPFVLYFDETSLSSLSYGSTYHIGVVPSASNVSLRTFSVSNAADMEAFSFGNNFLYSTFNGSTWTDDTTTMLKGFSLIIESTSAPAGGNVFVINE